MDEKIEEIVKQYPVHFISKRRIRGAFLLETEEGLFALAQYKDSMKKLEFEEHVKACIVENGYPYIDQGLRNEQGEWLTKGVTGKWLLKRWYVGRECNLKDTKDTLAAVRHLAKLHKWMVLPVEEKKEDIKITPEQNNNQEEENVRSISENYDEHNGTTIVEKNVIEGDEKADYGEELETQNSFTKRIYMEKDIYQTFVKRAREMKRVYNYIRNKRQRNDMEISLLNQFKTYFSQAQDALLIMESIDFAGLKECDTGGKRVCHGSYNYHNIIFGEKNQIATLCFDRCAVGIQIIDLYDFLRKMMEKNNWNMAQGMKLIEEYLENRSLEMDEAKVLYSMFLFPEKFWKQMNFYYNGKKAWMSMKNYEKLQKMEAQENARRRFLTELNNLLPANK